MTKLQKVIVCALMTCLLVSLTACVQTTGWVGGSDIRLSSATAPLPSGGEFTIQNINGSISITGWDRDEVDLTITKKGVEEDFDLVKVEVEQGDGFVHVKTVYPKNKSVRVAVNFEILLPFSVRLSEVKSVNGSVLVEDVEGPIAIDTVNGAIEVANCQGEVNAKTTNGSLAITSFDGTAKAKTVNGSIQLHDISKMAQAESVNGRISANFQDPRPDHDLSFRTVNGSIRLTIPTASSMQVEANTVHGSIKNDFGLKVTGKFKKHMQGRLGEGGSLLSLKSTTGSITLLQQ